MSDLFSFLRADWPGDVYEAAAKAAASANLDPRTSCFYARRALELAVMWAFKYDRALRLPYQDNLMALLHEPTFKAAMGEAVFVKAKIIVKAGNDAVHRARAIERAEAIATVRELFHFAYWFARTYARGSRPAPGLTFDPASLPTAAPIPRQTAEQLQRLESALRERDEKLSALLADKASLDAELESARAEVAEARRSATAQPDTHDYSEEQTRDTYIDRLLREAGWPLDQPRDREFPVDGMPNQVGRGAVDYVLWGDDGRPVGIVEAKRTRRDPTVGQQQAKLYADCLEKQYGQRPVIFCSNGYEHWVWDDVRYPPRQVQGFYTKDELALAVQRRATRRKLSRATVNAAIVERYYQTRAIRHIGEAFERDNERKALLVMATGAGKTRTTIALVDLLMRCNWVKRTLFLADRVALVNQAVNAFKKHLPDATTVNLVAEREADGRVYVSTYPTMMSLIDEARDDSGEGRRRFGVGHFDLVVIDEAHRSVFQKYGAIFRYFDALLVGLTATPSKELGRDTYKLFELEPGVPTDAYDLNDAVKDKFLVAPQAVSVPLKFQRDGISYEDLSEEEKAEWDAAEWDEDGGPAPARVEPEAVNKWLFNKDTVDKVLAHLMINGEKVEGGDRLGKTIIFAKNQEHAKFIAKRFDENYPHWKGAFARVITFETEYAQSLIDDFSAEDRAPHVAISVDMLDTGIDVPAVVNLVFFKLVRSKTKFWQMVGRGTRLRPDLFGPGEHKTRFLLFDYCQNLEYFRQELPPAAGHAGDSLGKRLFLRRLELVGELDHRGSAGAENVTPSVPAATLAGDAPGAPFHEPRTDREVRDDAAAWLHNEVTAMNLDNFVVRPRRRLVEKYAKAQVWSELSDEAREELAHEVAGLPAERPSEPEETKRFDLLMLNLELALLRKLAGFVRLRDQVKEIAGLLEEKSAVPMIRERLALIGEIQTDGWWQDVTLPMLEHARRHLRALAPLVEKRHRKVIYTDFEDQLGPETKVDLPLFAVAGDFEKFRAKARVFLRAHEDHVTIHKLRTNKALTASDLAELERVLASAGVGEPDDIEHAKQSAEGLGLFVRSLIGLDREAAKGALAGFLTGKSPTANQIEFVNLVVDHLTEHGVMPAAALYESPFTDVAPQGPDGIFPAEQVDELVAVLDRVRATALAN